MKRLYLTVEGQTEQAFAVSVLRPHLEAFNVYVAKPRLTGLHPRRGGRFPTGGLKHTFAHSLGDIRRWLREDQSADARFSMMIDLYSLPSDFPGYEAAQTQADVYQRVSALERALAQEINDRRFVPYLQIHEFEALLLAQPEVFREWFTRVDRQVAQLVAECEAFESPERIDLGRDSHPKARIKRHVPDYDENVDGPILVEAIGLERIRSRCPHFDQWLKTLEGLDAAPCS